MTDKEKIVDKIKKLLALSKSSNEHEASLAMENANKLLMKHNLEMSDIEEIDMNDIIESEVMSGGRMMSWKLNILSSVMELNNCQILLYSQRGGKKTVKAIGKKTSIEVSVSMYDYLIKTMDRIIKNTIYDIDVFSFRIGFAYAITQKIKEIITERSKADDAFDQACTALVVVEKALIQKFMNEQHPDVKTKSTKTNFKDSMSFSAGHQAGRNTSLSNQIN